MLDVLVIGAGQAGLALGHLLARSDQRFQLLDAGTEPGRSWRTRWDSLRLFTPAQYNNLPGLPFPAPANTYPTKDDVAEYLKLYAATFDLPVQPDTTVATLTRTRAGSYLARTTKAETWKAWQVVVATGGFDNPTLPPWSSDLDPDVHQVHSSGYRNPDTLPPGRILVVGAGNTGCQITQELSATREVDLAVGKRLPTVPQRPLGRDVWWWARRVGVDRVTVDSRVGRRMSTRDVLIGLGPRHLARHHGVRLRPRGVQAAGRSVTFADGTTREYDTVIWATGFTADHSWIDLPEYKDRHGRLQHERGVTASPGLYLLGLPWQHTRGSALLGWVHADAAYVTDQIHRQATARDSGVDV